MRSINYFAVVLLLSLLTILTSVEGVVAQSSKVKLSSLDLKKVEQSWWTPQKNRSITGEVISVAGVEYSNGIGTHSTSSITVKLDGKAKLFTTKVGLDDISNRDVDNQDAKFTALGDGTKLFYYEREGARTFIGIGNTIDVIPSGSVEFIVSGDGKELWRSGVMKQRSRVKSCSVDVEGVKILTLQVVDGGDGEAGDHANWIESEVTYGGDAPEIVYNSFQTEDVEALSRFEKSLKPQIAKLPVVESSSIDVEKSDWLLGSIEEKAMLYRSEDCRDLFLTNGLVYKQFRVTPNLAATDFQNSMTGEAILRSVNPEARVTIDGKEYAVGGLEGQKQKGYILQEWVDGMYNNPNSFYFTGVEVKDTEPMLEWKKSRWSLEKEWRATGKRVELSFQGPKGSKVEDITITVIYEMFDNMPVIQKWIEVENSGSEQVIVNNFVSEVLGVVEYESSVDKKDGEMSAPKSLYVESNYSFGGFDASGANKTVCWERDLEYTSQVNYGLNTPCKLEVKPPLGPDQVVESQGTFSSFRTYELLYDGDQRERNGLAVKKMYRTIMPWVTENPIFMHLTTTDFDKVKTAVDQCAEVGYEMVILSFGSGLNVENLSSENLKKFKDMVKYAADKGVELGGYSLLSSRWISDEVDVINPATGKRGGMIHGSQPCIGSEWGETYFQSVRKFYEETGMRVFEHDGSYPGNPCASTEHKHHKGLGDSQWYQWSRITKFYKWMRSEGIYINVPDYYFMSGTNKTGIGYREVNWSLTRAEQLMLGRQNIYDGQWDRLPGMCWTFVPLVQYHGGGADATLEPLKDHLADYESHMIQNYGSGIQACYRGPRLYDCDDTKVLVKSVIDWYKEYRDILNSEIVHIRRADGKDFDGIMHVNPSLENQGMIMLYNPTDRPITKTISLSLYYTGITTEATLTCKDGSEQSLKLDREYNISLDIDIAPRSYTWYVVKSNDDSILNQIANFF